MSDDGGDLDLRSLDDDELVKQNGRWLLHRRRLVADLPQG